MLNRFIKDFRNYFTYARYSARMDLKAEVASSYLNWLWWILDPLLFMMVYTFIATIVFDKGNTRYFPLFVFVGLTLWNFFNKTVQSSVKLMRSNQAIVEKVYLPKFILVVQKMMVNGFKMLISFGLVVIMMLIYRVRITFNVLYMAPILLLLILLTFGISCIVLHFGVYVDDLSNIMNVVLRLMFYMSGIFYNVIDRLPEQYANLFINVNPMALLLTSARNTMLYESPPYRRTMLVWFGISLLLSVISIWLIYKHENSYAKVI